MSVHAVPENVEVGGQKQGHSTVRADELVLFFSDRTSIDTGMIAGSVSGVERIGR